KNWSPGPPSPSRQATCWEDEERPGDSRGRRSAQAAHPVLPGPPAGRGAGAEGWAGVPGAGDDPARASTPAEKAGECPKPLTWVAQPCTEKSECADDLECGDDSKCCFNGCAKKCIPPYKANPGRCPAPKACLVQIPKLNKCLDDFPCRDGQKCCNVGCHLECVEPLPGSRGRRPPPPPSAFGSSLPPPHRPRNDNK
uniref:Whey acidic protein n=1 Tax=Ornithorhynchus anatinus TaxID=9258 RepID=A0A6I8PAP1_ORNAN